MRRALKYMDIASMGFLMAGAANSSAAGITKTSATGIVAKRSKTAVNMFYLGLAAATAYQVARALGPKTKSEKRVEHIAELYDKADTYGRRAKIYRRVAESFLRQRYSQLKAVTSR